MENQPNKPNTHKKKKSPLKLIFFLDRTRSNRLFSATKKSIFALGHESTDNAQVETSAHPVLCPAWPAVKNIAP